MTAPARGRHVSLHPPSSRDRDEFLAAVARSRRLHGRWVSPPSDHEGYAAYLRRLRRNDAAGFLVRRTEDDALAGAITLSQIVLDPLRSAYCGYYAFAPLQGQGLMTEAMELTVRYAFRTLRLHRIEANMQAR